MHLKIFSKELRSILNLVAAAAMMNFREGKTLIWVNKNRSIASTISAKISTKMTMAFHNP